MTLNSDSDFAFLQDSNGDITAGGYKLQTNFSESGVMSNIKQHESVQTGGAIKAALKDLAVPAGLFYLQRNINNVNEPYESVQKKIKASKKSKNSKKSNFNTDYVISENMFDKLLAMVDPTEKKVVDIKTRKKRKGKHNKTRKNKNK